MDDPSPSKSSWLVRLSHLLLREPEDRAQLIDLLHSAFERQLLDADALAMIEGVLQVGDLQVRDIMLPRSQIDFVDVSDSLPAIVRFAIDTAHSRFPVIGDNKDDVLGILHAKDLLRIGVDDDFDLRDSLRPAVFVPESKRLNVLLKDFRNNRNHMAVVVDEYGGVAGLVTIEDVLEQIIGDIEDEFDFDETEANIIEDRNGKHRVKAITEISDINDTFDVNLSDEEFDTIGGLVIAKFGHVPKRGEQISFDGFAFQVLRADSRRLHSLLMERLPPPPDDDD
jgi:magnesium and cobalt transporter